MIRLADFERDVPLAVRSGKTAISVVQRRIPPLIGLPRRQRFDATATVAHNYTGIGRFVAGVAGDARIRPRVRWTRPASHDDTTDGERARNQPQAHGSLPPSRRMGTGARLDHGRAPARTPNPPNQSSRGCFGSAAHKPRGVIDAARPPVDGLLRIGAERAGAPGHGSTGRDDALWRLPVLDPVDQRGESIE